MVVALRDRLDHILENIDNILAMLEGATLQSIEQQPAKRAAFERYLEIISEASRHIPHQLKVRHGAEIPWRSIADLGNVLRHAYHLTDGPTLWRIYERDLLPLREAVLAMTFDPEVTSN